MAWSVNDIYLLLQKLTRTAQSGRITATDLFYHWNAEQHSYYQDLVGRWEARGNGKPGPNTGLSLNEIVQGELAPFVKNSSLTISAGAITKPTDYKIKLAARLNNKDIDFILHSQIASANASVIDPPSATDNKYYATEYATAFKILPSTATGNVDFDYLAVPTDVVWAYTLDGSNRQVYSAAAGGSVVPTTGSVQPQWKTPEIVTITKRVLKSLGVAFKENDFVNAGQSAQITGA